MTNNEIPYLTGTIFIRHSCFVILSSLGISAFVIDA
jgi:hypothetical protein